MSYNYQQQPQYQPPENPQQGQWQEQQGYQSPHSKPEYDVEAQQNYAPPPPPQGQQEQYGQPPQAYPPPNQSGQTFNEKFKVEKPKWNDPIFTLIFVATCGGFIAVAVIGLKAYTDNRGFEGSSIYNTSNTFSLNTSTIILFAFVTAMAVILAFLYYLLARLFTRQFIIITIILNLLFAYGTAIAYLVQRYWSAGIVLLVFAVFSTWCFWTMRSRIPFATVVLKTVIGVTREAPSTVITSALGALFGGAFSIFFAVVLVSIYVKYDPNPNNPQCANGGCSQGKLVGLIIFLTFAAFYISEVVKNVIHVTISGVYGSWYYCSRSDQGWPKHPALGAFRRAMTYSFGSICFGSLIVAIINFIRQIIKMLRQANIQNGGNIAVSFILLCADCFISILDWAVTYFNHYAYTYIALYGKSYLNSARDTWQLLKHRGIDALVNDSLISNVLNFGSLFVGYTTALLAYLYLKLTRLSYNSSSGFYPIVVAYAFLIGTQIGNLATVTIHSGVSTFFVALAKDPEVFRMSYPDIYEEIVRVYPPAREKLNL
ncbi:protein Pns1p [Trichomonascus vanleenenianus]|uniref:Pns1p n=1 Tax=Trichomonascus vanleenenianus TaxID=2268995 RepID=UPI003EC9A544